MMKKFSMAQVLLLACAGLITAQIACSGMNQDPLAGQPEDIRNGQRPGQKATPGPTPENSEMLQIDSLEFFTFQEGVEGEARITGRVFGQIEGEEPVIGKHFTLRIENLSDFTGRASFDAATGVFKWTPDTSVVETGYSRTMTMMVTMETLRGRPRVRTKAINVFVTRDENDPQIISVDDLTSQPVREGDTQDFVVKVKDPDADLSNLPRLLVVTSRVTGSAAGFISQITTPERDYYDRSIWNFRMRFNAGSSELTSSSSTLSFGLVAFTRFGRSTPPRSVDIAVRTRVAEAATSWPDAVVFKTGQDNVLTFSVFDPKNEGTAGFTFNACAFGATCSCSAGAVKSSLVCTVRWTIAAGERSGSYDFSGTASVASPVMGDTGSSVVVRRRILVEEGPVVAAPEGARR